MHPGITMDPDESKPLNCHVDNTINRTHCTGKITVQDFKPRHLSFSLGYHCENNSASDSLKGLVYYFRINATNETQCFEMSVANMCYHYMKYGLHVNLFGGMKKDRILFMLHVDNLAQFETFSCQNRQESLCWMNTPQCNPKSKKIIQPCKEMCSYGCKRASVKWIDCNYFPSFNGDIYCFKKPISCSNPPTVDHATLSTHFERGSKYSLFDTVMFTCDEGFEMIGNNTINCNHSGQHHPNVFLVKQLKHQQSSYFNPQQQHEQHH